WRICRGFFPTHAHQRDKGIQCPPNCVVCNNNCEDTVRILFACPLSVQVWRAAGLWNRIQGAGNNTSSATDTIFLLLQQLNAHKSARMTVIMWSLRKHRNLKLWQNLTETCAQIVDRALQICN
ncbi:cytochrome p450, partial [Trifolium pratense]